VIVALSAVAAAASTGHAVEQPANDEEREKDDPEVVKASAWRSANSGRPPGRAGRRDGVRMDNVHGRQS
jgi:hypothetical protein